MKKIKPGILPILILSITGCASNIFTEISYDVKFDALDSSKDGTITIVEFKNCFPRTNKNLFALADADKDGKIYPDEWYEFREKKGYINP